MFLSLLTINITTTNKFTFVFHDQLDLGAPD